MRGLKHHRFGSHHSCFYVASFTDAWIETGIFGSIGAGRRSHLLQMRGLKLTLITLVTCLSVASFTDAWIETSTIAVLTVVTSVASFTDAWIETLCL